MGGEATMTDEPDPDAPWKPGYEGPPLDPPHRPHQRLGDGPSPAPVSDADVVEPGPNPRAPAPEHGLDRPDPWSRAAEDAPVPDWRTTFVRPPKESPSIDTDPSAPLASVDGLPAPAVTGELVLGAVIVLAVLLSTAFIGRSLVVDGGSDPPTSGVGLVPRQVDELWSLDLGGRVARTAAADGVVIVEVDDRVSAYDQFTGDELWTQVFEAEAFERAIRVIDGVAVVLDRRAGGWTDGFAFDARTGDELWSRTGRDEELLPFDRWLLQATAAGRDREFQTIDPATGDVVGPRIGLGQTNAPLPRVASWDDGRVTLYDLDTGARLGGPVDGLGLQSVDELGGTLVGFGDDGKLVVFDDRGTRVDERRFVSDVFGDFAGRAQFVGSVPGHEVAIVSSGSSIGFTVVDDRVEVLWEVDGRVGAPVATDVGPVSVARVIDRTTGEVNLALVDAPSGATITVTDVGVTREIDPLPRRNAYVVSPEVGASERAVTAVGYDDQEWWSLPLAQFALYEVLDSSVLVVERGPDRSTITMFG